MRKQVVDALEHRASDRVPIDFGGTNCSGIHASCVEQLRAYYGLEKRPVKIYEPFQMLGLLEEDLKQAMGVDTEPVLGPYTVFGFPNEGWKEYRLDSGQEVLVSRHFNVTKDEKGDTYIYPRGDTTCEPSGHMPYGGYYFDAVERAEEVDDDELTVEDNLEEFTELTAKDPLGARDRPCGGGKLRRHGTRRYRFCSGAGAQKAEGHPRDRGVVCVHSHTPGLSARVV